MPAPLRLVFAGTPGFAVQHLQKLLENAGRGVYEIAAVYTPPDQAAGRGRQPRPSPVKRLALEAGLPLHQPGDPGTARELQTLDACKPDLVVVVAYGLKLPPAVLQLPRLGCINVHPSLLPRWRGAAPVQRAIAAGDATSGVSVIQMDEGLDTGDLLEQRPCAIKAQETAGALLQRLGALGAEALDAVLQKMHAGEALQPTPQKERGEACTAAKIRSADAWLCWEQSARSLGRWVRALDTRPPAAAEDFLRSTPPARTAYAGQTINVWRARAHAGSHRVPPGAIARHSEMGLEVMCGHGVLTLQELQLPGGRPLPVAEILRGHPQLFRPHTAFAPAPGDT